MADIGKILEAVEYCLTNGKCTECKFSKGRMFATCRYLMEDVFELLKAVIQCKDCRYYDPKYVDEECRLFHNFTTEPDWFCADAEPKET